MTKQGGISVSVYIGDGKGRRTAYVPLSVLLYYHARGRNQSHSVLGSTKPLSSWHSLEVPYHETVCEDEECVRIDPILWGTMPSDLVTPFMTRVTVMSN